MRPNRPLGGTLRISSLMAGLVGLTLLLTACASTPSAPAGQPTGVVHPAGFPVTLTDDEGVTVTLDAPPERIVTFAPSHTEIVFGLGLGDRLVGVSGSFDNYPPAARDIEGVGGAGDFGVDPNVEKVVSLEPDLFLAIAGGEHWKEQLRDLGVPVFTVDATSLDDLLRDIEVVGRLTGSEAVAAELVTGMRARAEAVQAAVGGEPPVPCFFETFYPPLFTVGPGSFIYDLLILAGCDPVSAEASTPYPEWSVESLVAAAPEVYLVSSESGVSPHKVARRPGFDAVEAVAEGRVVLIDSDLVARPGPRVVQGLEALVGALHPQAGI